MPKVTFSNGITINLRFAPPFPLSQDFGRLAQYVILSEDSAEVAVEKQAALDQAMERYTLKTMFRELVVPDDWEFPAAALSEGLTVSEGAQGRLLDYVRHEFVCTPDDVGRVNAIWAYSAPVTQEEISVVRQFFQRLRSLFPRRKNSQAVT